MAYTCKTTEHQDREKALKEYRVRREKVLNYLEEQNPWIIHSEEKIVRIMSDTFILI